VVSSGATREVMLARVDSVPGMVAEVSSVAARWEATGCGVAAMAGLCSRVPEAGC